MKQFDEIFIQKVKTAFSDYDSRYLADKGWKSFVSKQKARKKFALIIPIWVKAASVALLLSSGGLFFYNSFTHKKVHLAKDYGYNPSSLIRQSVNTENRLHENKSAFYFGNADTMISRSVVCDEIQTKNNVILKKQDDDFISMNDKRNDEIVMNTISVQEDIKKDKKNSQENIADNQAKMDLVGNDYSEVSTSGKRTRLIAGLAGAMSKVENVSNSMPGFALGLYVDQKITKKLSFRPGLALAKYDYSHVYNEMAYAPNPPDNGSTHANLDMITMEIPMNFVYTFTKRGNSGIFVSAGTSTVIYFNQQFDENYFHGSSSFQDGKSLSQVDYFGLANLSAGYSLPLGKTSEMLIEPYIQLPLFDFSSRNLKTKYGGLSLKFIFNNQKQTDK